MDFWNLFLTLNYYYYYYYYYHKYYYVLILIIKSPTWILSLTQSIGLTITAALDPASGADKTWIRSRGRVNELVRLESWSKNRTHLSNQGLRTTITAIEIVEPPPKGAVGNECDHGNGIALVKPLDTVFLRDVGTDPNETWKWSPKFRCWQTNGTKIGYTMILVINNHQVLGYHINWYHKRLTHCRC